MQEKKGDPQIKQIKIGALAPPTLFRNTSRRLQGRNSANASLNLWINLP
ncbi:hypothetical protein MMA231_02721 [Asticcacaulis sp. MM231]